MSTKRNVVVFERDERFTESGQPELDWRLIRQALPAGSCPLGIMDGGHYICSEGQWFTEQEVLYFLLKVSGRA